MPQAAGRRPESIRPGNPEFFMQFSQNNTFVTSYRNIH